MGQSLFVRYVNPWKYRREREAARISELRRRDGDDCRRCRRPMRFDVPAGHDQGALIQPIQYGFDAAEASLDNLCLTHRRCNAAAVDNTGEVTERIRRK